ncbi:hypothetical protein [Burkholderia ambifaria]|uniref:hypothetical protein n=1 Tax=Burkholderia ambifaria TaxID=152480 RepID=UPI001591ED80|nr:hypothetical protein [Burkholderia ambifaria]
MSNPNLSSMAGIPTSGMPMTMPAALSSAPEPTPPSGVPGHEPAIRALPDANTLAQLYARDPEAAWLTVRGHHQYLQQVKCVLQRYGATLAQGANPNRNEPIADLIRDTITQTVDVYEDAIVQPTASAMATYTKYITALGQMFTDIQSMPTPESEGRSHMQGPKMLEKVAAFLVQWNRTSLGTFATKAQAQAFADHFKAGTVKVTTRFRDPASQDPNCLDFTDVNYRVELSLDPIAQVVTSMADNDTHAQRMKEQIVHLTTGKPVDFKPPTVAELMRFLTGGGVTTRRGGVSPQLMEAFSLAIDDVKKTYDTDARLLMDQYSRVVAEYQSRLKAAAGLISGMAETCKMLLP